MSELRKQLTAKLEERSRLQSQYNEVAEQFVAIEASVQALQARIIRDEKLLAKKKWAVVIHRELLDPEYSTFKLECVEDEDEFLELRGLLRPVAHGSYYLSTGEEGSNEPMDVELSFDDEDIELSFRNDATAQRFIKEFGLDLDLSSLERQRDAAASQARALNKLIGQAKRVAKH